MPDYRTLACREYEELVFTRRAQPIDNPLWAAKHIIDWDDQPSRFKIYKDVTCIPLSHTVPGELLLSGSKREALPSGGDAEEIGFDQLSTILLLSNGVLRRKLGINWNLDHLQRTKHPKSVYARPAASGGGLYPFELYFITGPCRHLFAGVYHYDAAHHALDRLASGDKTNQVRVAAFDHPAVQGASQFILISINFWKNYFKYLNFCYHLVTQDVGVELGAIRLAANAFGVEARIILWFKDEVLNSLLGLHTNEESVFAVIALNSGPDRGGADIENPESLPRRDAIEKLREIDYQVKKESHQRSRRVFALPFLEQIHLSALIESEPRPDGAKATATRWRQQVDSGERIRLPGSEHALAGKNMIEVSLSRTSSCGRMTNYPAFTLQQIAAILRFATEGQHYDCDLKGDRKGLHFTRLMLFINHVQDLIPGVYSFDPAVDCLSKIREGDFSYHLQQHYFLENYNCEQACAILAIVSDLDRLFEVFGNRALRVYNAEVGLVTHYVYMACAAMSIGCGAIAGFDNLAVRSLLSLEGSGQYPLLLVLLGNQRKDFGSFDCKLI